MKPEPIGSETVDEHYRDRAALALQAAAVEVPSARITSGCRATNSKGDLRIRVESCDPDHPGPCDRRRAAGDLSTLDGPVHARPRAGQTQPAVCVAHYDRRERGHRRGTSVRPVRCRCGLCRRHSAAHSSRVAPPPASSGTVNSRANRDIGAPGAHIAIWMSGAYLLVATTIPGGTVVTLALGGTAAICCGAAVLRLAHHRLLAELVYMAKRMMGRGEDPQRPSDATSTSDAPRADSIPATEAGMTSLGRRDRNHDQRHAFRPVSMARILRCARSRYHVDCGHQTPIALTAHRVRVGPAMCCVFASCRASHGRGLRFRSAVSEEISGSPIIAR